MRIPKETVQFFSNRYYEGPIWTQPPVSAVFAQYQPDCQLVVVSSDKSSALNLGWFESLHSA